MPDQLWEKIEPILKEHDPSKNTGRPRVNQRAVLDAVIFRLRTGCQWNRLPSEFPDDSSVHRTFQRWVELGILGLVWASLLKECEELKGVTWEWQAADGRWARRVLGGSRGPEPRRSSQNRREALSVGRGRWRTARGGGGGSERARRQAARSHAGCGSGQASRTYRGIVPAPVLDKGYDNRLTRELVEGRNYVPHIRRIGEEKLDEAGEKRYPARRWVVERTLGWLSKCRSILVRYEKKVPNYLGMIKVACILLWYRRQHRLSVSRS